MGLPRWHTGEESACQCRRCGFDPWSRKWQPTPVFLSGEYDGQRSLPGYFCGIPERVRHHSATEQQQENIYREATQELPSLPSKIQVYTSITFHNIHSAGSSFESRYLLMKAKTFVFLTFKSTVVCNSSLVNLEVVLNIFHN